MLGVGTPKPCKKLSFKYLVISNKTSALAQAAQNSCFCVVHLGRNRKGVLKTMSNILSLKYLLMQKKLEP